MNEAQREAEVQDALSQMREDLRTHAPNNPPAAAQFLLAALKRLDLRVVSNDEWDEHYEDGVEEGMARNQSPAEDSAIVEALAPRWVG